MVLGARFRAPKGEGAESQGTVNTLGIKVKRLVSGARFRAQKGEGAVDKNTESNTCKTTRLLQELHY